MTDVEIIKYFRVNMADVYIKKVPTESTIQINLNTLTNALIQLISSYLLPLENHALLLTATKFKIVYTTLLLFEGKGINLDSMNKTLFKIAGGNVYTKGETILQLPINIRPTLRELYLSPDTFNCITDFLILRDCPQLQVFTTSAWGGGNDCSFNFLTSCPQLRRIELKSYIYLRNTNDFAGLTNLTSLSITISAINDISGLTTCTSLTYLQLLHCEDIKNLNLLATLPLLHTLTVISRNPVCMDTFSGCTSLTNFTFTPLLGHKIYAPNMFPSLHTLTLQKCASLEWLAPLPSVTMLDIMSNNGFDDIRGIYNFINLTKLCLRNYRHLTSLGELRLCSRLYRLELVNFAVIGRDILPVINLDELKECPSITELYMHNFSRKYTLHHCQHLKYLHISESNIEEHMLNLDSATSLTKLELVRFSWIFILSRLQHCRSLEFLHIDTNNTCSGNDASFLTRLRKIKILSTCTVLYNYIWMYTPPHICTIHLQAPGSFGLSEMGILRPAPSIRKLTVSTVIGTEPNFLHKVFTSITTLCLKRWNSINSLSFILSMPYLVYIRITECIIKSLYPLAECTSLYSLTMNKCSQYTLEGNICMLDFTLTKINSYNNIIAAAKARLTDPVLSQLLTLLT